MADKIRPERHEGPTPAGGAYSLAFFRDIAGNPAPKEQAVQVEVHECAADGEVLQRTYADLPPPR